ncbi:Plasmid recombination enzyme type 1 [Thioalkalivibrio nitratireducens DSM 14787]|uniref:Plasmid recombination enzyme type 1 n=1 Tax=Thioalkalivibrio nitratireducens (strain DSM 14787 / UNIQEM 213 / ALEN2) TaxID=1255043 RepID=L0DTV0_THIND|nr:plasmid recombination protein [Thioalkalivibrio nitratireducens]AGA32405.1 Plasmid recombination enzyme type 1 [Thioalkalivibrio nitratireducens DSM 14787]
MSKYVSIRLETATRSAHGGQRAHDLRSGEMPDYVDPLRSKDNSYLIKAPNARTMASKCLTRRQSRTDLRRKARSIRKDGIVALKGLLGFSAKAQPEIESLAKEDQDRRFKKAAEAVAAALGTTLVGLVVHRDEAVLHAHFVLDGYGHDGKPLSTKLTKGTCSGLQDTVATAYADLGITRGKYLAERIQDGEDYSKTIHRSVRELHRDLPRELEAVRAQVAAKRAELDALEKAMADVELPAPQEVEVVTGRSMGFPQTEMRPLYTVAAISKAMKNARAKQKLAEDKAAKAARDLEDQTRELERLQRVKQALEDAEQAWPRVAYAGGPYLDFDFLQALRTPIETRYEALLQEQHDGQMVIAPPQAASARQIGAALCSAIRDRGWERAIVTASDEVAAVIRDLAQEEGVVGRLTFTRQGIDFKTRGPSLAPGTPSGQPEVDPVRPRSDSAPGAR